MSKPKTIIIFPAIFFGFLFFAFLIISPVSLLAQTTCASYATLAVTSSKTTYPVSEPFSGEIVFTNNTGPARVNFTVTATKDGYVILTKYYNAIQVLSGRNAWTLKDALGTDVFPGPGTYLISVAVSHQDSNCLWSAELTLTATAIPSLFVPDKYVPLSTFLKKENINQETLTFQVKPDILQYLTSSVNYRISIAHIDSFPGAIEYLSPSSMNAAGSVALSTTKTGVFVVVSNVFLNDFPIFTHWDQSLNGGKGGPRIGAADPLAVTDFDAFTNQITERGVDIRDYNPTNPYHYATDKLALFSGDSQNPNARVPSYERYIGENYSRFKITDLLAIYISDQILRNTGYPVINKNYVSSSNPTGALQQNIPAFQVLFHYLIAAEPDKASLATFILPPRWSSHPAKPYPILFNGFYDDTTSYVSYYGIPTAKIINDLMTEGYGPSIVILWNSGGALAVRALQRSVYDNAALLFDEAKQKFGADPHKIVTFGLSRGALTALLMASDPYHDSYTVKYALAYNSTLKTGEHINFANPSFPALLEVISMDTGYKYAWMLNWTNPDNGWSGKQTLLYNLLGTIDPDEADNRAPFSDQHIAALKRKGTKVLVYQGTHDVFMPFSLTLKYVDKLALAGIPLRFEIGYRFGHSPTATDRLEYAKICLRRVLAGDETFETGTFHYKRKSEAEINISVPFTPSYQPVFLQAPKAGAWAETLSFVVVGGKGTQYYLKVHKIDDALWENQKQIQKLSQNNYLSFGGVLENIGSSIKFQVRHVLIAKEFVPAGYYLYELFYSIDNGNTWLQVVPEGIPLPYVDKQSVLQILTEEPLANGVDIAAQLGTASRIGGLSSDAGSIPASPPLSGIGLSPLTTYTVSALEKVSSTIGLDNAGTITVGAANGFKDSLIKSLREQLKAAEEMLQNLLSQLKNSVQ